MICSFQKSHHGLTSIFLSFQGQEETATVSSKMNYTHIKDNYYTNQSNEVLNFGKGRVIYVGEQNLLGKYVTILLENNIEVTFGNMQDVFVSMYDQVVRINYIGNI